MRFWELTEKEVINCKDGNLYKIEDENLETKQKAYKEMSKKRSAKGETWMPQFVI